MSNKPIVFLHIGPHKTGTTSIQYALATNRQKLLENDIHYPVAGCPIVQSESKYGQHELYWFLAKKKKVKNDDPWQRLREEVEKAATKTVIISAEGLSSCDDKKIKLINRYLSDFDVRIILYTRSIEAWIISSYKQYVKSSKYVSSFHDFYEDYLINRSFDNLIYKWSSHFGHDNIIVRDFDEAIKSRGLLQDFASALELPGDILEHSKLVMNESPSDHLISVLWVLNKLERTLGIEGNSILGRIKRHVLRRTFGGQLVIRFLRPFSFRGFPTVPEERVTHD